MTSRASSTSMLTEAERLYYLDAMEIQAWALQAPGTPTEEPATGERGVVRPAEEVPACTDSRTAPSGPAVIDDTSWQRLEQQVAACTLCELHASRTQTVFGVGDRQAQLLIIGEAPGQEEDRQGEPFVGRAGMLLTAMLKAIGLRREQVYIANILKCRPPNNRDPLAEEIAACQPYLLRQVELLQPRAIFAIGRIAAHTLLNTDASIGSLRGRVHSFAGVPLVVGYHPAYLLRRPIEKRKAWEDLRRVHSVMGRV